MSAAGILEALGERPQDYHDARSVDRHQSLRALTPSPPGWLGRGYLQRIFSVLQRVFGILARAGGAR